MDSISVTDIRKSYDGQVVLEDLSFTVETGAVFGLLGPNGAGKTTTIDILTGVRSSDSGIVQVLGQNPGKDPIGVRESVGILPEKESPPSFFTPREYFNFIADIRDIDSEVVSERISEWAERLHFTEKLDVRCNNLSRGQQQKVMLTQALIHEPELVFIDEPLANLDPLMQERVKDFIREYNERGHTVVLCTHHIEVAEELCTEVGILNDGQLRQKFDPRTLSEGNSVRDLYLDEVRESDSEPTSTEVNSQ